jgi:glyoxylase-like metal-dependent hydrolase (beta-lactamase superfamily II)
MREAARGILESMTRDPMASRRSFLRSASVVTGGAMLLRYAPAGLLAQANTPDAMRAQTGALPIETTKLADRLIMLSGPGGNVVVLHGDVKIVVDGFVQPAWPRLKAVLDGLDGSPIRSLVDTHWHFDHTDNNLNFRKAGAGIIAHDNTKARMSQPHDLLGMHFDPSPTAALPTQTFPSGLTLNANGEQIRLTRVAPAHTDTDIFVFFPKANVLHMGDVFFNGMYPFIDASTGGNIDGMIAGVQAALKIGNAQTQIVPGHGPLGHRASLDAYGRMLTSVRDAVRTLKAAGRSLADVQAAKPSASFDAGWGKGMMGPDDFVALVYNTLR